MPGSLSRFSLLLFAAAALHAADSPWDELRQLHFNDARTAFAASADSDPWAVFGEALAHLNAQPKTRGHIEEARRLFTTLADSADTDLSIRARYFLGRIAQVHAYEPDPAAADRIYTDLLAAHPTHPFAQLAASKLALLRLYDPHATTPVATRFAELERYGAALTDKSARRDFHYVMGVAALFFKLPDERALDHLLASADAGMINDQNRANVYIRIAEIARRLGQRDVALRHYRLFLEAAPREVRTRYAAERVAELEAGP